jgi:hypothetical protein
MSTAKLMHNDSKYFDELPVSTQKIVKEAILKAASDRRGPEGCKDDNDCIEPIECRSRDGFTPYNHNKGGLVYRNFTHLMGYWGGGYTVSHAGAAKEIERQIELSFKYLRKSIFEKHKALLESKGITENQCDYYIIYELAEKDSDLECVERDIENGESEALNDSENSIMHEIQVKYEGKNFKGLHVAYVSAAVNTEGPYHRSHISWAPGVFCEGVEGVQIKWSTNAELKRKLEKALVKVCKAVF